MSSNNVQALLQQKVSPTLEEIQEEQLRQSQELQDVKQMLEDIRQSMELVLQAVCGKDRSH